MKAFTKKFKKTFHKLSNSSHEGDHDRQQGNHKHEEHHKACNTSTPAHNAKVSESTTPATLSSVANNVSINNVKNESDNTEEISAYTSRSNALHNEEEMTEDGKETLEKRTNNENVKFHSSPLQVRAENEREEQLNSAVSTNNNKHDVSDKIETSKTKQNLTSTELKDKTIGNQINDENNDISIHKFETDIDNTSNKVSLEHNKSQSKELINNDDISKSENEQIDVDVDFDKETELLDCTNYDNTNDIIPQSDDSNVNRNTTFSLEDSDNKFHVEQNEVNTSANDSMDRSPSIKFEIVENGCKSEEKAKIDEVVNNNNNCNDENNDSNTTNVRKNSKEAHSMVGDVESASLKENLEIVCKSDANTLNSKSKLNEQSTSNTINNTKANNELHNKQNATKASLNSINNKYGSGSSSGNKKRKERKQLIRAKSPHSLQRTMVQKSSSNHSSTNSSIYQSDTNNKNSFHTNVNAGTEQENYTKMNENKICSSNSKTISNNDSGNKANRASSYRGRSKTGHRNSKSSVVSDNISVSSNSTSVNVFDYQSLLNQCHRKAEVIAKREERLGQHQRSELLQSRKHKYRKAIEAWQSEDDDSVQTRSFSNSEHSNTNSSLQHHHHHHNDEKVKQTSSHHSAHRRLPQRYGMHKQQRQEEEEEEEEYHPNESQRSNRDSSRPVDNFRESHEMTKMMQPCQVKEKALLESLQKRKVKEHDANRRYSRSLSELSELSNTSSTYTSELDRRQTKSNKRTASRSRKSPNSQSLSEVESVRSNKFITPNTQHRINKEQTYTNNKNDFLESCKSNRSRSSGEMSCTPHSRLSQYDNSNVKQQQRDHEEQEQLSNSMHTPERFSLSSLDRLHEGNDTEPSRMSKIEEKMLTEVEERIEALEREMREYDAILEQNMLSNSFERLYHLNNKRDRAERESRLREFKKLTALKEKLLNGEIVKNLQHRQERRKMWERRLRSPDNVFERLYLNSPTSSQMHRRERSRTQSQNSRTSSMNRSKRRALKEDSFSATRSSRTSSSHSRRSAEEVCSLLYTDGLELTRRRARQERQNAETRQAEELQELLVAKLAAQLRRASRSDKEFLNSQLWLTRAREELHRRMERDPEHYAESILRGKKLTKEEQQMSARRLLIHGKAMKERLEIEKHKEEMKECTFHPKINDTSYSAVLTSSAATPVRSQSRNLRRKSSTKYNNGGGGDVSGGNNRDNDAQTQVNNSSNNNNNNSNTSKVNNGYKSKYNANEPTHTKSDRCVYLYKSAQATRNKRAELEAKQAMERRKSILKNRLDNDHHFRRRVQLDPTLAERFMNSLVVEN